MFRYYRNTDDFDRKRKVCDRALQIAETVGYADLAHETRVIRSYVEVAHCIFVVADQRATLDLSNLECQATLWSSVERLKRAGTDNTQAIRAWRASLGPTPWHPRVLDAIAAMETTVKEITQFIAERDVY